METFEKKKLFERPFAGSLSLKELVGLSGCLSYRTLREAIVLSSTILSAVYSPCMQLNQGSFSPLPCRGRMDFLWSRRRVVLLASPPQTNAVFSLRKMQIAKFAGFSRKNRQIVRRRRIRNFLWGRECEQCVCVFNEVCSRFQYRAFFGDQGNIDSNSCPKSGQCLVMRIPSHTLTPIC